jgi:hypothetical protein
VKSELNAVFITWHVVNVMKFVGKMVMVIII